MNSSMASPPRQAALAFILVTVMLDMLAFGIVIPVLPRLVLDFTGGSATTAGGSVSPRADPVRP